MFRSIVTICLSLLLLKHTFVAAEEDKPNTFTKNSSLTAASNEGTELWRFEVNGDISPPAIAVDGTIYVGTNTDYLYALDSSGTEKWRFKSTGTAFATPSVSNDGTIFVGSDNKYLYALSPSGKELWRVYTGFFVASAPAIGHNGIIYATSFSGALIAVSRSGNVLWAYFVDANLYSSPVIGHDGVIYFSSVATDSSATNFSDLYAINPDGTLHWKYQTKHWMPSQPAIGEDGEIYVVSYDTQLYSLNKDGTKNWSSGTDSWTQTSPIIGPNGNIYLNARSHHLFKYNKNNGHRESKFESDYLLSYSPPVIGDNEIIYFAKNRNLYAVDLEDNSLLWNFNVDSQLKSGMALDSNGTLYFSTINGSLYAIASSSDRLFKGGWPKEGFDNQNTGNILPTSNLDTDGDGVADNRDLDDDNDNIPDYYEFAYGLAPLSPSDAAEDTDNDGLSNLDEFAYGTKANHSDSDHDGVPDGEEIAAGTDPTVSDLQSWKFTADEDILTSPAIGKDGTVYVTSLQRLYAISPNGSLKWMSDTLGQTWSSPSIGEDGTIYVGSLGWQSLHAFSPEGIELWRHKENKWITSTPAIDGNGTVYVTSTNNLLAIDDDGNEKWRALLGDTGNYSSPVIDKRGNVYIGADRYLIAFNSKGTKLWQYEASSHKLHFDRSVPAIADDGTIYWGISWRPAGLHAINPDGTQKWLFPASIQDSSPAIGEDGTIYVGSNEGNLYAINPDGTELWRFSTTDMILSSPAVGADGVIYFGGVDSVYAVDPKGKLLWKFEAPGTITSSPTIGTDGLIYVGAPDHNLYALQSSSMGLANSVWPKFAQNNQNSLRIPIRRDATKKSFVEYDFNGNGKADLSFRRETDSTQYIYDFESKEIQRVVLGKRLGDIPLVGDFDGDKVADIAIRRPSTQFWYIKNSSGQDLITGHDDAITRLRFGIQPEDIPVPADYDGDGITDIAVRRPSTQYWYIRNSTGVDVVTGNADGITRIRFGLEPSDIPVVADYDGDGIADLAVRRPSDQYWYIRNSTCVDPNKVFDDCISRIRFGREATDIPVPADYDGDGRADLAVRRPKELTWYVLNSSGSNYNSENRDGIQRVKFGLQEDDIPIVADYDGDGIADFAIRRPSDRHQYIKSSKTNVVIPKKFGLQASDIPLAAPIGLKLELVKFH